MNITHISCSRAPLFFQCKYRYKLKYHLLVPSPIEPYPWFLYGSIIHKIIETYTTHRGKLNIGDIAAEVLKSEKKLSFNYQQQLKHDLESFMHLSDKIGTSGEVEVPFNIDLDIPKNKILTGFIDRLIEKNGTYYVLDWKTTKIGEWQKTEQTILDDLQMSVYAYVVSQRMNVPADKIKCSLYYMQGRKLVSAKFSQQTLDNVPKKMLKIYNEIMESNPDAATGTVGKHCGLCEYSSICPYYAAT